jgi:DNA repair exonuclease SbcCD ATPase subunit
MDNAQEITELIKRFTEYRNILTPLQENLHSVADSYEAMKKDVEKIDRNFGDETRQQLDKIYGTISAQAKQGAELSTRIDRFLSAADSYTDSVKKLTDSFSVIEQRLATVDEIEKTAEEQIARLNEIIDEKKINYNTKDLQKSLENYNKNVEKISDFINKDVARVLQENGKKIDEVKQDNDNISALLAAQNKSVETLVSAYRETGGLLRTVVGKEDVNEQYIFDILDKWAQSRRVKIKK